MRTRLNIKESKMVTKMKITLMMTRVAVANPLAVMSYQRANCVPSKVTS